MTYPYYFVNNVLAFVKFYEIHFVLTFLLAFRNIIKRIRKVIKEFIYISRVIKVNKNNQLVLDCKYLLN